ncbi:MAG: prepilin peptidase [Candidatus Woesearchaeota archaeon]
MLIDVILLTIAFVALVAGTITDIKTREVPDWISFGVIFAGIGIRLIYSTITFEWAYLLEGVAGLAIFVVLGYIMFYAGQWGGGDSKLLMGLGALLGFNFSINSLIIVFTFNALVAGALYGLIYSVVLAIIHRKEFGKNFHKLMHSKQIQKFRKIKLIAFLAILVLIVYVFKDNLMDIFVLLTLIAMLILVYLSFYLVIFVKAVELSAMYKWIEPDELTEGDWIAKDVIVNKKKIVSHKSLGVEKKQIKQLIELKKKGKINQVKVKYGIPFVPSFLAAFIVSVALGAWWLILI